MLNNLKYINVFSPGFLPGIKLALLFFLLLFYSSSTVNAQQNLVVNGDFEEFSNCPNSPSSPLQIPYEVTKCNNWDSPTYGTSDYFNVCSNNATVQVPVNYVGSQNAHSGNGYLGFASIYQVGMGTDGYNGPMWWEYIEGHLSPALEQGKIYKLSIEVSLAEYSDLMINELGVYFSKNPVSTPNTAALTVIPQCVFNEPNYFRDSLNWIHLETNYMASGGEEYITIGNFRDNLTNDTVRRYSSSQPPLITYFYIDDVVLKEEIHPTSNIFTPNGDGINDLWLFSFPGSKGMKITIINRWGNLIKEGDLKGFSWDGKTKDGNDCSDGTYFYRVSNTNIAGFIQLIR